MWRFLAFGLAFTAILAFQFAIFPGHSYLAGDSLLFVPILEHLDHPGLLSRDLLAVHPNVTYTIYDEATLFLEHVARISMQQALLAQLLVFRAAGLAGVYWLARSLGLRSWQSLAVAALVNCGAYLPGVELHLVDGEPVPAAFAFDAILLAAGLFARRRPLAGGGAAGVALLYDAALATPFLLVLCALAVLDQRWRRLLRGSVAVLFAFALLLANLAQLQPGVPEAARLADRIPPAIEAIQRWALPQLWISLWSPAAVCWYIALGAFLMLVFHLLKGRMQQQPSAALLRGMPVVSLCAVAFSAVMLDVVRWHEIPVLQPLRTLLFLAAIASLLLWTACFSGWSTRSGWANATLLLVACALPLSEIASRFPLRQEPATEALVTWAKDNTWGGAAFLFPDAATASYPGVFRAQSERAVWVDWPSRKQAAYFDSFADEWHRRWQDAMSGDSSRERMLRMLALPIDYYVLRQKAGTALGVAPVYEDGEFMVFDANDLRGHSRCAGCLY